MNEEKNNDNHDNQKVSLASLLESKKAEISQKKADEQKEIRNDELENAMNEFDEQKEVKDNQLEEAMNEVDDKRVEIGNLSEKKMNLTEKQNSLSESLNSIKDNVKVFKESKQNLKDLYQKAKSDSDLEAFLKENGIESWEDLTKSEEFSKTDEVSSFSKAKEDVKKSTEGRKSQEEKVREEYGLDDSFKGKILEGKIGEEKTKVESEIEKLRPETPEGQNDIENEAKEKLDQIKEESAQIKERTLKEATKKVEDCFNKNWAPGNRWKEGVYSNRDFKDIENFAVIERGLLAEESGVLGIKEEDLWKNLYRKKIDAFIATNNGVYAHALKRQVEKSVEYQLVGWEISDLYESTDLRVVQEQSEVQKSLITRFNNLQKGSVCGLKLSVIDGRLMVKNDFSQIDRSIDSYKSNIENEERIRSEVEKSQKAIPFWKKNKEEAKELQEEISSHNENIKKYKEEKEKIQAEKSELVEKNKQTLENLQKIIDLEIGLTPEEIKEMDQGLNSHQDSYRHKGTSSSYKEQMIISLDTVIREISSRNGKLRENTKLVSQYTALVNKRELIKNNY